MTTTPTKFVDRNSYLGGSDAAAAVGVSPWKTPLQLYMEKRGETDAQELVSNATGGDPMFWGTHLEGPIADASRLYGLKLAKVNKEFKHPDHDFIRGHIDRRVVGVREMVEIKNIGFRTAHHWGEAETDDIPLYYMTQAFHYLGLTQYQRCHFLVLVGGQDLRHYVLERDQEAIDMLYRRLELFWSSVQTGSPPAPQSSADLTLLYPNAVKGEIVQVDAGTRKNLYSLRQAQAELKQAEETVESFKNVLKYEMKTADLLYDGEHEAATWKAQSRRSFNSQSFKEDHPELYQQYMKTTKFRVFRTKAVK